MDGTTVVDMRLPQSDTRWAMVMDGCSERQGADDHTAKSTRVEDEDSVARHIVCSTQHTFPQCNLNLKPLIAVALQPSKQGCHPYTEGIGGPVTVSIVGLKDLKDVLTFHLLQREGRGPFIVAGL